jgi:3-dehydroquinate synthase
MRPLKPVEPVFCADINASLKPLVANRKSILLCDEHTLEHCVPLLHDSFDHTLVVKAGEEEKSLAVAENIWKHFIAWNIGRSDVLVCLGGGVLCDLGAFSASVYQRGMPFILIPTTLLAMTDAAIGGKTGINLLNKKNYIGSFAEAEAVFIHTPFLKTLPRQALTEGWAEMLKHALIADSVLYHDISGLAHLNSIPEFSLLQRSINVKVKIVQADPIEQNLRKLLNFGHTLGHALESWYLERNHSVAHGTAVAAGIWLEALMARQQEVLSQADFEQISALIDRHFEPLMFSKDGVHEIAGLCRFDKKNQHRDSVNFVLLQSAGKAVVDGQATTEEILFALSTYLECHRI